MTEFSNKLQALREAHGWSKTYVSKQLNLKLQRYSNYEYGTREPDFEILSEIADLYGVSTDYLLGNEKNNEIKKVDLTNDDVIFTYEGRQIPKEDLAIIKRLMRGGKE